MKRLGGLLIVLLAVGASGAAQATDMGVFTVRAGKTVLEKLAPQFERSTGHKIKITFSYGPALIARIGANEPFDVLISGAPLIDDLAAKGKLLPDSRTSVFRSGMGIVIAPGVPRPDISSPDKLKLALLQAKSIAYLKRVSRVEGLLDRLGIADEVAAKSVAMTDDNVAGAVVKGEAALGITAITQIVTTPYAHFAGSLPSELQYEIDFAAGISAASKNEQAARDLIQFLSSPAALTVIKAQGMEPADK